MHDDLEDLLAEVADAHLPGYKGAANGNTKAGGADNDTTAGLTAAQKKRRKKKNKKKEK